MVKLFSTILLIVTVLLGPPAALAVISNDALPGELTYPIKRKLEDGIVLVASINPISKAWFSASRSDRRFKEVNKLLAVKSAQSSQALAELVSQTNDAANQVSVIKETEAKQRYIDNLSKSISKYNTALQATQINSPQNIAYNSTQNAPTGQTGAVVATQDNTSSQSNSASQAGVVTPPQTANQPTTTNNVTVVSPVSNPGVAVPVATVKSSADDKKRDQEIEEARKQLEDIKKNLEEERKKLDQDKQSPQPTPKSSPSPTTKPK